MYLKESIQSFIQLDPYPQYTIYNLYFDTCDYEFIYHSIEKPVYKEKLRLRSYGPVDGTGKVYLELKKKCDGVVFKRRVTLSYEEAMAYLLENKYPIMDCQIMREIDYVNRHYQLEPKLFLAYDRIAYSGILDQQLRITFDRNIRYRFQQWDLNSDDKTIELLKEDQYLMEIKAPKAMPIWLVKELSKQQIYPVSFSKYGAIYKEEKVC